MMCSIFGPPWPSEKEYSSYLCFSLCQSHNYAVAFSRFFQGIQMMVVRSSCQLQNPLITLMVCILKTSYFLLYTILWLEREDKGMKCETCMTLKFYVGCFCSSCVFKSILEESGGLFCFDQFRREVLPFGPGGYLNLSIHTKILTVMLYIFSLVDLISILFIFN